jgi:hypothetical protein
MPSAEHGRSDYESNKICTSIRMPHLTSVAFHVVTERRNV